MLIGSDSLTGIALMWQAKPILNEYCFAMSQCLSRSIIAWNFTSIKMRATQRS